MKITKILIGILTMYPVIMFSQNKLNQSEAQAALIIQFGNSVIDLRNYNITNLESYESILSAAEGNIRKIKTYPDSQLFAINCQLNSTPSKEQTAYNTEAKKASTFTEKNEIKNLVKQAELESKKADEQCKSINQYFTQKQFKSDPEFTKYVAMSDSLRNTLDLAKISWSKASQKASKAGDRAEIVLMKKSKIADFVIPMKTDLSEIDDIVDELSREDSELSQIKERIATLTQSIQKNQDISTKDVSKLKDIYYKSVYEDFYRACNNIAGNLGKIVEKLENKDYEAANSSYSSLINSEYNKAVNSYNTFIKQ